MIENEYQEFIDIIKTKILELQEKENLIDKDKEDLINSVNNIFVLTFFLEGLPKIFLKEGFSTLYNEIIQKNSTAISINKILNFITKHYLAIEYYEKDKIEELLLKLRDRRNKDIKSIFFKDDLCPLFLYFVKEYYDKLEFSEIIDTIEDFIALFSCDKINKEDFLKIKGDKEKEKKFIIELITEENKEEKKNNDILLFSIGGKNYGIENKRNKYNISTIISYPEKITKIPNSHNYLLGIFLHENQVLPLFDMREILKEDKKNKKNKVILKVKIIENLKEREIGLLIDVIEGFKNKSQLIEIPNNEGKKSKNNYLLNKYNNNGKLVFMLELDLLFDELFFKNSIKKIKDI